MKEVHQDEMVHLDLLARRESRAFQVPLDFKGNLVLLDCQVQLDLLEVLEVLARRGSQVLQDSLDCLELQLLLGTLVLLGPLDLLALKVKMETRVLRVIVENQGRLACLVQLDLQAEKVYKGKRENRDLRVQRVSLAHEDQKD